MWPSILGTVMTTVSDTTFPRIGGSRLRRSSTMLGDTPTTTGGLQLWLNDQKEGQITSSYDFNAASPNPDIVYVEGTQTGEGSIMLNWQKNATAAPQLLDTVYYNVWQMSGPQNVPGYGKYVYNVSLPSSISPNPNNFTAVGGTPSWFPPLASSSAQVQWNSGGDVGELTYNIGNGFSGQWNVNVVQVSVSTPTGERASTPGTPQEFGVVPENGTLLNLVEAGNWPTTNGLVWNAQVTLTGATSLDWGVSQVQFGFIQNGIGFQNDGTYADGTTLKSSLDGFITASSPIVDYKFNDANTPWADGNTYTVSAADGYTTSIIAADTPRDGPPLYSGQSGAWEANNAHALTYMTLSYSFNLYVCAQTLDNENNASSVYTEEAMGSWSFNGSGNVTVNSAAQTVSWIAGAGAGVAGFSSWTAVTSGDQPVTTAPSFNDLLGTETFSDPPSQAGLVGVAMATTSTSPSGSAMFIGRDTRGLPYGDAPVGTMPATSYYAERHRVEPHAFSPVLWQADLPYSPPLIALPYCPRQLTLFTLPVPLANSGISLRDALKLDSPI